MAALETKKFVKQLVVPHAENQYRPHLIRHPYLAFYVVLLIIYQILAGVIFNSPQVSDSRRLSELETGIVDATNRYREDQGLTALTPNGLLNNAAHAKAVDMIDKDYFDHIAPDGRDPWSFIEGEGYHYSYAAENLAKGFDEPEEVFDAWRGSAEHNQNMLAERATEIGIAAVAGRLGSEFTVVFVELVAAPAASDPGNRITQNLQSVSGKIRPHFSFLNPFLPQRAPFVWGSVVIVMFLILDGYMLNSIGRLYHIRHRVAFAISSFLVIGLLVLSFINFSEIF